jgi:hypothetical protein
MDPAEREHEVDERERQADERERQADEREHEADEREHEADEREHKADEREHEADEREDWLLEHIARLRQQTVEIRARGTTVREHAEQAVARAEAARNANEDRMRRAEAALDRAYAHAARQQANVDRSVRRGEQRPVPQRRDFTELAGRVSELRKRTAAAAGLLAMTEEHVARTYDELASRDPGNPRHKRRADEARKAMRRARELERRYSSS